MRYYKVFTANGIGFWLAVVGMCGCLGLAITLTIPLLFSFPTAGLATVDFNHFHELWIEAIVFPTWVIMGAWAIIYFLLRGTYHHD